jgi:hypothetical protein
VRQLRQNRWREWEYLRELYTCDKYDTPCPTLTCDELSAAGLVAPGDCGDRFERAELYIDPTSGRVSYYFPRNPAGKPPPAGTKITFTGEGGGDGALGAALCADLAADLAEQYAELPPSEQESVLDSIGASSEDGLSDLITACCQCWIDATPSAPCDPAVCSDDCYEQAAALGGSLAHPALDGAVIYGARCGYDPPGHGPLEAAPPPDNQGSPDPGADCIDLIGLFEIQPWIGADGKCYRTRGTY